MTILDRYLLRAMFGGFVLVMAVLLILAALFTFIGQQDDIGTGRYTTLSAFWFTLLSVPQQLWELAPIGALIGALLGLGSLARGSEITVMRASGFSVARLAGSVLIGGLVLMGVEIAVGEFLAPALQQAAKQKKAFDRYTEMSFGGSGGAWVRDGDLILNVSRQTGERVFRGMLIFELSPDHRLRAVGQASQAIASTNRRWMLSGYAESRFTRDRVLTGPKRERMLASNVSAGFLGLAVTDPRQLQSRALWNLIQYYNANNLDARPYVFAFWSRIARVTATAFTVLLAVPFVLGSLRSSGAGARMVIGLLIGISFFLVQRLIESGTIVFALNPVLLAWLPTVLLAIVTLALLARARRA